MAGDRTARRPDGLRGERPRELPRGGRFCGQGRVSCGSWPVALTEASANAPVIAAVFVQVQWKRNDTPARARGRAPLVGEPCEGPS